MSNCYVNDFNTTVKTYYKNIKNCNPISREQEKELFKKAKNNDLNARNKILTSNLKFVFDVAKNYKGFGVPIEDLISEGNIGLVKAYEKFDVDKDIKFISYAVWWIKAYIKNYIKKQKEQDSIIDSDEELFKPIENINVDDEDQLVKADVIMSNSEDALKIEEEINAKEIIKKLLNKLNLRERTIIECYFGLNDNKEMNLEEIGKKLNLSRERIRQVKEKSLLKLRSEMLLLK